MVRDWRIIEGDCLDAMRAMEPCSVDAVVCDPPYDLTGNVNGGGANSVNPSNRGQTASPFAARSGFMGMKWDGTGIAFRPETWAEVLRVAKPGAHLLSFGGTRTHHRMACAIEDAGWEIRDTMVYWAYAQGFPKSKNLDGEWQGYGSALKPSFEPVCMARKPLAGTLAATVAAHGTGALNIDGCRIPTGDNTGRVQGRGLDSTAAPVAPNNGWRSETHPAGRWPANLLLSEQAAAALDAAVGERPGMKRGTLRRGATTGKSIGLGSTAQGYDVETGYGDTGGPSRFFPTFPADEGDLPLLYCPKASASERSAGLPAGQRSHHPTVKPLALMRWLCRLITPPGGLVLDPFTGSGTTGCAALLEGFRFVGIEQDASYCDIARARIAHWAGPLFGQEGAADD